MKTNCVKKKREKIRGPTPVIGFYGPVDRYGKELNDLCCCCGCGCGCCCGRCIEAFSRFPVVPSLLMLTWILFALTVAPILEGN